MRALELILAAVVWSAFAVAPAYGASLPPVLNEEECQVVADMALTSRTLDKHGIGGEKADRMLGDIYVNLLKTVHGPRAALYLDAALRFAASPNGRAIEPGNLSIKVYRECMEHEGDLTGIFGADS